MSLDKASQWIESVQDNDPYETPLFRHLVKKPRESLTPEETLYVNKYRRAFQLELVSLLNIPVSLFCFAKCLERFTSSFLRRRTYKAAFASVLTLQVNLMLYSLYLRKVKKYSFENKLQVHYGPEMHREKSVKGGQKE